MSENFYHILGIARDADEREIKKAYHRLARELHPDKQENPEKAREAEQKFALASTAYNLLKDPEQRKDYDRKTFADGGVSPQMGGAAQAAAPTKTEAAPPTSSPRVEKRQPSPSPGAGEDINPKRVAIAQKAYVKGVQLMREKDYAKSAEFLEAAISNNPNEATYHAKLSIALIEAKKSANRAIEAAQKAIELDRYNLDYKFNLASIYQMIGSKTNAIRVYEEILKWDKGNTVATQMLRELRKTGSFFEKLTEKSPLMNSIRKRFQK